MAEQRGDAAILAFVFTDIEGSTRLWETDGDGMRAALVVHDDVVRDAIAAHGGEVFATGGDGFAAAFSTVADAAAAVVDAQLGLARAPWPGAIRLRMRAAVHVGTAQRRDDNYFGPTLNRTARLMATGHGGQVLCSEAAALLLADARPPDTRLVDLGSHRLRDLARAERVFQLEHAELERDFPPLRSLDPARTNLPVQATSFVGRDDDVARVVALAQPGALVTLTGVGGVGKTRLALHAAVELLATVPDGAFLVELGSVIDVSVVADVVASALGVQITGAQDARGAVVAHLAARRLVLVLDNCEHVLDSVAELVTTIMRTCAEIAILATSREPLGVPGEHIVAVSSLPLPSPADPPDAQVDAPAMQLLVERAALVRSDFKPTPDTVAALVQICRRLDGIPLALELAAARLRSMAPAEIAQRLDQRFRLLTGGGRGAVNRHQTLRRTIDWSYELLDGREQVVFERASVFAGGFDLTAAEAVCAGGDVDPLDVLELVGRLVDKSLVVAEDVDDATRYRMLETVRDYALERLEARDEIDDVRLRHAEHFASFASEAGVGIRSRDERTWMERVERELENLRVAVLWSAETGHAELACEIVAELALEMNRLDRVVGAWAELLAARDEAIAHAGWPRVLSFGSFAAIQRGDFARARELRDAGRDAMVGCDPSVAVRVLDSDMIAAMALDGGGAWMSVGDERLTMARVVGDDYEIARAASTLAIAYTSNGRDGSELARESVVAAHACGNPAAQCSAALASAAVAMARDPARALAHIADAEAAALAAGNDSLLAIVQGTRATALDGIGDDRASLFALLDACDRLLVGGYNSIAGGHLRMIAGVLAARGDDEPSAVLFGYTASALVTGPEVHADALAALSDRLGAARYDELTQTGARFGDSYAALAFARETVEARFGAPDRSTDVAGRLDD